MRLINIGNSRISFCCLSWTLLRKPQAHATVENSIMLYFQSRSCSSAFIKIMPIDMHILSPQFIILFSILIYLSYPISCCYHWWRDKEQPQDFFLRAHASIYLMGFQVLSVCVCVSTNSRGWSSISSERMSSILLHEKHETQQMTLLF